MTLRELAREYRSRVAPEDFDLITAFALGQTKEFVMREPETVLDEGILIRLRSLLDRRTAHEPVAFIVGEKEFYGLPFFVTRDTLIPRPETEILVESVAEHVKADYDSDPTRTIAIADIGTGSGVIIVSLAKTMRDMSSVSHFASDLSRPALDIARRNATRHDVDDRVTFLAGHLLAPIAETSSFSDADTVVIAANLPYLSETILASAPEDVRSFEPLTALIADDDGLALYLELLDDLARRKDSVWSHKRVDGFFEISPEQESRIRSEFARRFPDNENYFVRDLSGRTRLFRFRIRWR